MSKTDSLTFWHRTVKVKAALLYYNQQRFSSLPYILIQNPKYPDKRDVKVTSISHESRREENIANDGSHLLFEGLTASLPALFLVAQAVQQRHTTPHLSQASSKGVDSFPTNRSSS